MGVSLFFLCALIAVGSPQTLGVIQTYHSNTLCQGAPSAVEPYDDQNCIPAPCTPISGTSSVRYCGPAVGIAILTPSSGSTVSGWVAFQQINVSATIVTVNVSGITTNPGTLHGIHVHSFGDLRGFLPTAGSNVTQANSVGSHFNPTDEAHGCPGNASLHDGDLGNWQATGGSIISQKTIFGLNLTGIDSIIGRAVVVHAATDDCVNVASSGARLATGVIGIANVEDNVASPTIATTQTTGVCVFSGTSVAPTLTLGNAGTAYFTQQTGSIRAQARVFTDDNITRGFHVHQFGDLSITTGLSTGPHLNPDQQIHGLPTVNLERHLGDFGSVQTFGPEGNGWYDFAPPYSPATQMVMWNFIGRGVIVHASLDHGDDPSCPGANTTGDAGARSLYCVIGIPNTVDTTTPGNCLEVPVVPTTVTLINTWTDVPCPTPPPVPVSPPPQISNNTPAEIIPINQPGLFPESLEWNPYAGQFIVGSLGSDALYQIAFDGGVLPQIVHTGLVSTGVYVIGNQLFSCWADFPPTNNSFLYSWRIDTTPYTFLWSVDLHSVGEDTPRFCNDITSDENGNLWATDSIYNIIYRITIDSNGLNPVPEIWSDEPIYKTFPGLLNLNGIVYHPNGYLIVSMLSTHEFLKIMVDPTTFGPGVFNIVSIPSDNPISGPDGLILAQPDRIIVSHTVEYGGGVSALVTTDDFTSASVPMTLLTTYQAVSSIILDDNLYVLQCNLDSFFSGKLTSTEFSILKFENDDFIGVSAPNRGWIAAVVICLFAFTVAVCGFIVWQLFFSKPVEHA